jgi:glycosyltransferase involved in cell wall biosynthesis
MRLLFLSKQRPQGRDLLRRPYGRFHSLPRLLAERGHEVQLLLLSYLSEPERSRQEGNLRCEVVAGLPQGLKRYLIKADRVAKALRPDWIIGFSDTWYGILAQWVAERNGCRSLIDAYDNYESYIPWLRPLPWVRRRAVARADMVTATGPQLVDLLARDRVGKPTHVVPMAADPGFYRRDRKQCRERFEFPQDKKLIGYFGSLYGNRGIEVLFDGFRRIRVENREVEMVVSGRADRERLLPEGTRWLGYLADEEVPWLLGAVDVAAVMNRPDAFGSFSYPAKLYEAMACGVPVVASDTAAARWILKGREECLAIPGNAEDLQVKLVAALDRGYLDYGSQAGWAEIAADLEDVLLHFSGARRGEV